MYLVAQAEELRRRASRVSEFTNIANLTPFLLPYRNFDSSHYEEMVECLYHSLGVVDDITGVRDAVTIAVLDLSALLDERD